ncbi:plasmid transfer protein TraA [Streptomyces albus]|uniref:plasmid transfer protein TraA n=1 Tax=Streptomyces albus TaxID=1888 RepID=UPI00340482FA
MPKPTKPPEKNITKNRSVNPSLHGSVNISIVKTGGGQPAAAEEKTPGSDFLSNEDIHKFCEDGRKRARKRAVERALDAEMLEGRLQNIPDVNGAMAGARARARRVTRWLKRIAQAEKMIAKWYAALYSAFEREYEAQLVKIGKGRAQQKPQRPFHWR